MKRTLVASAFIRKDDKYLLVYDPKFKFWRVPGGKVRPGEKDEETIKREMFEELDLEIAVEKYLGEGLDTDIPIYGHPEKDKTSRRIKYYECSIESGELKVKEKREISEYKWLTLDEIKNHDNLEPAMLDYFSKL
jgi:8-oxo-dGTP pyrophosphatase MutT (NUDIX family)